MADRIEADKKKKDEWKRYSERIKDMQKGKQKSKAIKQGRAGAINKKEKG